MNLASAAIFLGLIAALCVTLWGLVTRRGSVVVGVIAASLAVLAAGGAWYAWAESQSVLWAVGYGLVVVAGAASARRQFHRAATGAGTSRDSR